MEDSDIYDGKLLDQILYDGKDPPGQGLVRQSRSYKIVFTPDYIGNPCKDPERLEKLLLGQHFSSKRTEEIYDPLDLIQSKVLQDMIYTEKSLKSYLNDKRQYQVSKLPTVHTHFFKELSQQLSSPTVVKVTNSLMILGNAYGVISVYNHSAHELNVFQSSKTFGPVTSIDISNDELFIITGYTGGQIALWGKNSDGAFISIRANNSYHTTSITSFKFWKNNSLTISSDISGRVMIVEYTKNFLSTSISAIELLKGEIGPIGNIEILQSETTGHTLDSSCLVAIAGEKAVLVYVLSPEIACISSFHRPESVPEGELPCVAWKYIEIHSELSYSLSIAWGSGLMIYNVKFPIANGIELYQSLDLASNINSLVWLSRQVLVAITEKKEIILKPSERKIICECPRSFEIVSRTEGIFSLCKGVAGNDRKLFLMGGKEFYVLNLLTWNECIDELSNKGEWLEVLCFGLDLYEGKFPSQYGFPESIEELRNILEQLVTIYVKVGTIAWVHKISNTIEFCVGIGALDILFNMLLDFFVDHGEAKNMDYFVSDLEPYVLTGKIKKIPEFVIGKIMGFYLRQNTPELIEKILMNLDNNCVKSEQVLPIIAEYQLLSAAICVYSKINDFLAPAVMIFQKFSEEKDLVLKRYYFYKLLWYVRMCFQGKELMGQRISEKIYNEVIKNLVDWIVKDGKIEVLIKIDSVCFLHVIEELCLEKFQVFALEIIQEIYKVTEENTYSFEQFCIFIAIVTKTMEIKLPYEITMKAAKFLLGVKYNIESIPIGGSDILLYIHNFTYGEQGRLAFTDVSLPELGKCALRLLKTCEKITNEDINDLLSITHDSSHILPQVFLFDLKQDYKKSLQTHLQAKTPEEKDLIFSWIWQKFKFFSENSPKDLKSFQNEVSDILSILVDINSDKTAQLVRDWFQNSHNYIIKKLDNAPNLQLKYLGELLKDQFDKDLVLLYVKLLCQQSPERVLKFLKTRDVEFFDESLKICAEYKVITAEAYLNEKLGAVREALDLLISTIQSTRLDLIAKMRKKEVIIPSHISELGQKIHKYGKVCIRNISALDLTELEEFWFSIFKNTLDCYVEFKEYFYLYPQLEPMLHNSVNFILTHMLDHVDLSEIITCISSEYEDFPFKHMRDNIVEVLTRHTHQKKIMMNAIRLLKKDTSVNVNLLFSTRLEGQASDFFLCKACGKKINGQSTGIYIFACGHVYHKRCQGIPVCFLCTDDGLSR